MIGVSRTSLMVGGFGSKALLVLSQEETNPLAVRCGRERLLCCLIVAIYASGISIPLSLLMLLGWSLTWIASITVREYQWGSRSRNLTSSQSGQCPILLAACSETAEVWVRESRISLSWSSIRSCTHRFRFRFADVYFATFTRNLNYTLLHLVFVGQQCP